jgi:hypothetical protein
MSNPRIRSEWVDVSPRLATELLQKNKTNRPLSKDAVRDIVDRMKKGQWVVTHQGLGFDFNGDLVDGQHRLAAVVQSGITHRYLLTYDLDPQTFDHIDVGGKGARTAADLLARRVPNLKNRSLVCATASVALRGMRVAKTPDKVLIVDFCERQHQLITPFLAELKSSPLVTAPVLGAFVAAARALDEPGAFPGPRGGRSVDDLMVCAMRFRSMEWGRTGDPLKTLFERLLREQQDDAHAVDWQRTYSLTVAALRAELAGRTISKSQASDTDWGEPGDHVVAGSPAHRAKLSVRQKTGKAEPPKTAKPKTIRRTP